MRVLFAFALIAACSLSAFAQKDKLRAESLKKDENLKLVFLTCPQASIINMDTKPDYLEVQYWCNDNFYEMGIHKEKVLYIETHIDTSTIPMDKILKKLAKDYLDWKVEAVTEIFTDDATFLKLTAMKDGVEQNLFFTHDGKWYKSTPFTISGEWTEAELLGSEIFDHAPYPFLVPDQVYELPAILREISGLTVSDQNTILCVQDELGVVFEYDTGRDEIINLFRFTDIGDFEAVTTQNGMAHVLRSDGTVFSFDYRNRRDIERQIIGVNALNFESLTYDASSKKFYTVSKDAELNLPESIRRVYEFSPQNFNRPRLAQEINTVEINDFITQELPETKKPEILFNPSDIAIHPISKEMYVLSANDRVLLIYNAEKKLKGVYPLPAEVYHKPEGIAFYENGDMLISNEGDKKGLVKPSILYFKNRGN